jgi:hypothetical protein
MAKASPGIINLNAGEFSPMLDGRIDYAKYPNAASRLENFIPTVQGPYVRRGGTRYIAPVKDAADGPVLLVPFEYSVDQAYVLEFGDQYVRFYTWDSVTKVRGRLEVAGVPVEVATPYTSADLYNADGTPTLRWAQSGDFLYLAHPSYAPRILQRTSATSFTLTTYEPTGGPWKSLNDTATTVYASAATGSGITLTASASIFQSGHVGALFYLESKDVNTIPAWEVSKSISAGAERRSDGKTYSALNTATTGTNRPVHTEGALYDGDTGVQWEYRDPGYGWVRITGYTSGTVVTATVLSRLPSQVVGSGNATARWAHGEWSSVEGWPTCVSFYRERQVWARGRTVWFSVAADFTDYQPRIYGQVTDDAAFTVTLSSGKINDVQWIVPDRDLLVGTAGGEFAIGELTNGDPLGPNNRRSRPISEFGSRSMQPVRNGNSTLFIQRSGLLARETFYEFGSDGYESTDTTVESEHITRTGVTQMVFADEPTPIAWCMRADGLLIGFTWNNEQKVRGWHRHPIGGDGVVESIAVIPAAEGDRSELWLSVKRTIDGNVVRYVEYMDRPWRDGDDIEAQFYVDSGLTYDGAPATTISGLDHLEGCTVGVLSDGSPHPQRTVTGGEITLQRAASVVQIGLPCPCYYKSMRLEAGAQDGVSQGKTKRISRAVLRFLNTVGGSYGGNDSQLDDLQFRTAADAMGVAVPLYTGDKIVSWPDGYSTDCYLIYTNTQPTASTLVAIFPQVTTQDAR